MHDVKSNLDYQFNIPLRDIDPNTDLDDDGLVEVDEITMEMLDKEYIDDNITIRFSEHFDFMGEPIHTECKYYMIIIAIYYYGNALREIYDVTS